MNNITKEERIVGLVNNINEEFRQGNEERTKDILFQLFSEKHLNYMVRQMKKAEEYDTKLISLEANEQMGAELMEDVEYLRKENTRLKESLSKIQQEHLRVEYVLFSLMREHARSVYDKWYEADFTAEDYRLEDILKNFISHLTESNHRKQE